MPARPERSGIGAAQPRVSLVLLGFNQQAFIAEGVRSAFAQDYPELEIVLSDHGSADGTFRIMSELAEAYSGPHRVVLNRSASPGGVLGHLRDAAAMASGGLIVMAAGDDVSLPHRVSRLVDAWQSSGAALIHSAAWPIDAAGRPLPPIPWRPRFHDASSWFPDGGVTHVHGATAAYDRAVLEAVPPPDFPVFTEDLFLTLMFGLRGARSVRLDEPLVRYCIHPGAWTARGGLSPTIEAQEAAICERSHHTARLLRYAEAAANGCGIESDRIPIRVDCDRLAADAAFHEAVARWYALSAGGRLAALRHVRRREQLRWMLPRLLGMAPLTALKRLRGGSHS